MLCEAALETVLTVENSNFHEKELLKLPACLTPRRNTVIKIAPLFCEALSAFLSQKLL